jgi:hypothetical protein
MSEWFRLQTSQFPLAFFLPREKKASGVAFLRKDLSLQHGILAIGRALFSSFISIAVA